MSFFYMTLVIIQSMKGAIKRICIVIQRKHIRAREGQICHWIWVQKFAVDWVYLKTETSEKKHKTTSQQDSFFLSKRENLMLWCHLDDGILLSVDAAPLLLWITWTTFMFQLVFRSRWWMAFIFACNRRRQRSIRNLRQSRIHQRRCRRTQTRM